MVLGHETHDNEGKPLDRQGDGGDSTGVSAKRVLEASAFNPLGNATRRH